MKMFNVIKTTSQLLLLLASSLSQADVLIDVTATMVEPACNIRSENSSSPLNINFGTLNIDKLNTPDSVKGFSLYLTGCNFSKTLAIVLNPKGSSTLDYNGKNILSTNTEGLGIDFNDATGGGAARSLEVSQKQRIDPERINDTEYRMDIQAQLVSAIEPSELKPGKFTATVSILVTYE